MTSDCDIAESGGRGAARQFPARDFGFDDLDLSWLRAKRGEKWRGCGPGALPASLADMDYPVAPAVREALDAAVRRGDLGYPAWSTWTGANPLAGPFADRMDARHGWRPRPEWVRNVSDLLQALQVLLRLATRPGDAVAVQTPSYPPFLKTIEMMDRRVVACPFERDGGAWSFDAERLERDVRESECRVLLLVNPHNPTGRVLTRAELESLAGIAVRHDLLVIADEIMSDLCHAPHRHIPMASLGVEIAERTITVNSATKAFNFAGLRCAVMHLAPEMVREAFDSYPPDYFGPVNVLGVEATKAAWSEGDAWLAALTDHLRANRDLVAATLAEHAPAIGYDPPESAYLAWLDCRELGLAAEPAQHFREKARVELIPGRAFGAEGRGFTRLNFATSRTVLTEMLHRMADSLTPVR
ncbi:MalY/PatB family protein [Actinomadura litoris]|uniref:cysteine-S-conjugate beta-lyase n=1 Tax=Actinomadura litoris TaxID=2678616 RepID=A0A7K1LED4_9ACTN|nr:aminotransferase class I/II-fold pyridoxal phosphate-dependent enzyme [Actinomadura litoris]MUN42673.1 aminotransferase class I/II-fold pyridoxal phosphate-dependent enzyme [Actinomadura litoris]